MDTTKHNRNIILNEVAGLLEQSVARTQAWVVLSKLLLFRMGRIEELYKLFTQKIIQSDTNQTKNFRKICFIL